LFFLKKKKFFCFRGSTGVWQPVELDQRLRVSSKSGKAVRLQISARSKVDWSTVNVQMVSHADKERSGWLKQPMAQGYVVNSTNYKELNGQVRLSLQIIILSNNYNPVACDNGLEDQRTL